MNYNSKNEFLLLFKSNFKNPQFKYNIFLICKWKFKALKLTIKNGNLPKIKITAM